MLLPLLFFAVLFIVIVVSLTIYLNREKKMSPTPSASQSHVVAYTDDDQESLVFESDEDESVPPWLE